MDKKDPLIILTGPTAVGKTGLSIKLAKAVGGSVISADSMQVYRGMDIGSAKIRPEEMQGIRHYLIDVLDPFESFDVVRFQRMAKEAMREIYSDKKIPVVSGGTGFYIRALLYDTDFTSQKADTSIREKYEALARERGSAYLHDLLRAADPEAAESIHPNNTKRIIRALEFYEMSGGLISAHNKKERGRPSPYDFVYFVLDDERERLYQRIDERVDRMLDEGLLDEVKRLKALGCKKDMVSMQGLGYKELLSYLDGKISYDEAVRVIKRDTRHFAKRQLTWFRRQKDVIWIKKQEYDYDEDAILEDMLKELSRAGLAG